MTDLAQLISDRHNELVKLYRETAVFFASHVPQQLTTRPNRDDVLAVRDDLHALCDQIDAIVRDTADYVQALTGHTIDGAHKIDVLRSALDGNLFYEIEQAANGESDV
jgi:hypothetical protein